MFLLRNKKNVDISGGEKKCLIWCYGCWKNYVTSSMLNYVVSAFFYYHFLPVLEEICRYRTVIWIKKNLRKKTQKIKKNAGLFFFINFMWSLLSNLGVLGFVFKHLACWVTADEIFKCFSYFSHKIFPGKNTMNLSAAELAHRMVKF